MGVLGKAGVGLVEGLAVGFHPPDVAGHLAGLGELEVLDHIGNFEIPMRTGGIHVGEIRFEKVCKSFGSHKVIENLDLTIRDGSFTVLVGASGCGKTTLLRMIAGIGPATSGRIFMDGKDITDTPPAKRDIAMVFQNYAIYPTMTVRENIEFGLKNKRVPKPADCGVHLHCGA